MVNGVDNGGQRYGSPPEYCIEYKLGEIYSRLMSAKFMYFHVDFALFVHRIEF